MVDGSLKCQQTEGSIHKVAAKMMVQKVVMVGPTGTINLAIILNQLMN